MLTSRHATVPTRSGLIEAKLICLWSVYPLNSQFDVAKLNGVAIDNPWNTGEIFRTGVCNLQRACENEDDQAKVVHDELRAFCAPRERVSVFRRATARFGSIIWRQPSTFRSWIEPPGVTVAVTWRDLVHAGEFDCAYAPRTTR